MPRLIVVENDVIDNQLAHPTVKQNDKSYFYISEMKPITA